MKYRALVHMDLEEESRFTRGLGNLLNFLDEIPAEESELRIVANSAAVNFFRKERAAEHREKIERLSKAGVHFLICKNSLSKLNISESELIDPCEVVPAGIVEIIRLQNEGFAYVKP